METIKCQTSLDNFRVKYELCIPKEGEYDYEFAKKREQFLEDYQMVINDIGKFTNTADGMDYALAVSSGFLAAVVDWVFVGNWDFANAKAISNKEINEKIINFAKKDKEYLEKWKKRTGGNSENSSHELKYAIEFLENKYPLPGDNDWNVKDAFVDMAKEYGFSPISGKTGKYKEAVVFMNERFARTDGALWGVEENHIGIKTHHLDDFCHHPTLVGLICSILVQFIGKANYHNSVGKIFSCPVDVNDYGEFVGKNPIAKMFSGIINWFIQASKTIQNRKGHLLSDMAGSKNSAGNGMGIPGTMMSTLKELSALPGIRETDFPEKLRKAYQNGIGNGEKQISLGAFNSLFDGSDSNKLDFRTERAVGHELKRQAVPVVLNEIIVRAFYFIRHFIKEMKEKKDVSLIDMKKLFAIHNRTLARMFTISSGVLCVMDMGEAALQAAIKSKGNSIEFSKNFVLRVNFVGMGRFVVAGTTDFFMGVKKNTLELSAASAEVAETALETIDMVEEVQGGREKLEKSLVELRESKEMISSLRF